MFKPIPDLRNGYGLTQCCYGSESAPSPEVFPDVAASTLQMATEHHSSLTVANPGTGKSHLVTDMIRIAAAKDRPALGIHAHINGGTKRGVDNALSAIDYFAATYGDIGIIIIDNVDYYGYSGQECTRRYQVALAHTRVARHICDLLQDSSAPTVCGMAHNEEWRRAHWQFGAKRQDDEVTPAAETLLSKFDSTTEFFGEISERVALELLLAKGINVDKADFLKEVICKIKAYAGGLYYRYIKLLSPDALLGDLNQQLTAIDADTNRMIGRIAGSGGV